MIALVTGATGLVGSHLVERLLAEGWRVRALVRDPARAGRLQSLGAEPVRGDVLDAWSVATAARGCNTVFHTAATISQGGSWEAYRRPNVDGTEAAINAAAAAGARLLHLSSIAVFGGARYADPSRAVDESTPLARLSPGDFYGRSKRESEALVLDAHREGRIWATAVRPCVIYGRHDRQFVPRLARLLHTGVAPLVGGGARRFAVVHAANVADAAFRAATTDAAGGKAYVTANDFEVSYADFVRLAAAALGRPVRFLRVPFALARGAAVAGQRVAALARAHDLAGRLPATVDFLARDNPFSSARARRELGWAPPVRPEQGVPEAFAWWREEMRGGR